MKQTPCMLYKKLFLKYEDNAWFSSLCFDLLENAIVGGRRKKKLATP